ncbi:lamin tail domain-containing protein [Virgibacillus sp. Bac330]|uniref:lamin tail domain-containing protein n=1 Tax=Virgibacillus sp. Bac330 TaxID=2419841 RepID=UPI000EF50D96|nr:lamin tail domain-containing protein [Virgibacillus sp. Bac330]
MQNKKFRTLLAALTAIVIIIANFLQPTSVAYATVSTPKQATKTKEEKQQELPNQDSETMNNDTLIMQHVAPNVMQRLQQHSLSVTAPHAEKVSLFYQSTKVSKPIEIDMKKEDNGEYTGAIPKSATWSDHITYWFEGKSATDQGKTDPYTVPIQSQTSTNVQALPKIMITEVGFGEQPFIEIFNHSSHPIDVKDYSLQVENQKISFEQSLLIASGKSHIIWFANEEADMNTFHSFYEMQPNKQQVTAVNKALLPSTINKLSLIENSTNEVVTEGNVHFTENMAGQLFYYTDQKTWRGGGLTTEANPGEIFPGQVPAERMEVKAEQPENSKEKNTNEDVVTKEKKKQSKDTELDNKKNEKNVTTDSFIQHEAIYDATATDDLTITATLTDEVTELNLQFQTANKMEMEELPFTKDKDATTYSVTVPKEKLWSPNFYYQIVAQTKNGTSIPYPEQEPIHVTIKQSDTDDTQTIPPLLITEITPDTTNVNQKDAYEFIEIYNNTNQTINMNDYQLFYQYPDDMPDQIWGISDNKEIKPQESFIVWIKNEGNQRLTLADFNEQYGLHMPESHVTEIHNAGMANSGERTLVVADKFNNKIVSATYNDTEKDDTSPNQGVVYRYPNQGTSMIKTGLGQAMTPLSILPGQVPKKPVIVDGTAKKPILGKPELSMDEKGITVQIEVKSEKSISGASLSILQSAKATYQTWPLQVSEENPNIYSVTIPLEEIWSDHIQYYFTATNEAGEAKTDVHSYQLPTKEIDYQQVPPLFITEITPDTTNSNSADAYEFIEVYNNTTEAIDFKDYTIRYRYPNTDAGNDLLWSPNEKDTVIIPPGETVVFWIINHGNKEKTAADFNANYGSHLTEGENLFKMYNNGMANGSQRSLIVATKTGKELSYSTYNDVVDVDDTIADKGIFYRFPTDSSLHTAKISAGEWDATPGEVLTEQVPRKKVVFPKDAEKPVIKNTTKKKEITSEQPFTLSATITDNADVKSVSVHYRTDGGKFRKVNLETQATNRYEHIIYEPELIGKDTLEYYFTASDGANKTTSPTSTVSIDNPTLQEGLRLNMQDNEFISGKKVIKATADNTEIEPSLFVDQKQVTDTFKAMESDAYFAFDVRETNIYFKNGVTMGDEILHIFDDTHTKFTTITVPVSADKLKQGENTISIRAGNKVGPFDATSQENRDDFTIKNIRLVLSDGTTIYDPAYSKPNQDYSIGDSSGKKPVYDFTFTLDERAFASTAYVFDTTKVDDGKHEIKTVLKNEKVTKQVITDNTAPTITPSIKNGETYKGAFTIDANAKDATSNVESITAQLDGNYISLPYNTSSSLLEPGKHELSFQATDTANNQTEKKVTFYVDEEHPLLPNWLGNNSDSTSANLSVTVHDPTNDAMDVDFYQSYQYTADDPNMTISQNAVDTEPPQSYLPEGEERLTKKQLKHLQTIDGNQIDTTSDYQFPYHRFDVTVNEQVDANDEIEMVWNGSSLEGRKVTMYAWNYTTNKWDALVSTIAGTDALELIGSVKGTEYMQDQKVSVIVQDEIADIGENFSFVWMADTQYYSESYPHIYERQTEWIAENKEALNIEYVFHSGDLVDVYDDLEQWDVADRSMKKLDEANIPYGVVAGNHDVNNKSRDYSYYGRFFGEERFKDNYYYGDSFKDNRGHYDLMSLNGMDFIMVHLGWGIEEDGIQWLNKVLQAHPNRKAILNVHEYLLATGSRSPTGDQLFEEVVIPNENVFAVLSGHYHNAQTLIDDIDDDGDGITDRTVYQMLADYQGGPEGGQGYLRILNFNMDTNQIDVETYSPYLDDYNYYDPEEYPGKDTFSFDFDMSAQTKRVATDYVEVNVYTDEKIGSVKNVPSGEKAAIVWEGLDPNSEYFWYTVASDQYGGKTRSDIWKFLTIDGEIIVPEEPDNPTSPTVPEQPSGEDKTNGGDMDQNDQNADGNAFHKGEKGNGKPSIQQPSSEENQEGRNKHQFDDGMPSIKNTSKPHQAGSSLPNTATNMFNALFIGITLLLLGSSIWLIHLYRKKGQVLNE